MAANHEPYMPTEDVSISRVNLSRITAALTIIGFLLGALFWMFTVASTATAAKSLADTTAQTLEHKADKDDLKEMRQDIKDIRDFLLNGQRKQRE
jgi:cobalamin biosynthesis protein CobD/CbiB